MNKSPLLALLAPVVVSATELIQFEAGKPALSREVNENFSRLDTAIRNRATKNGLEATDGALKSVLATVGQLQTGKADQVALARKADTSSVAELARKQKSDSATLASAMKGALTEGGLSGIRDTLKNKQNSLGFTPLSTGGGTVAGDLDVAKKLSAATLKTPVAEIDTLLVPGARIQMYPDGMGGALYPDKNGTPGTDNYVVGWQRDGQGVYLRASKKYLGIRSVFTYPVYNDGVADRAVLHTGLLDTNRLVRSDAVVFKGSEYNDITTRINANGSLKSLGNNYSALRNALDFSWYNSHWQIGNMRSAGTNSDGFGISQGDSALKFLVHERGATVYGDMNITGTMRSAAAVAANSASIGDLRVTGKLTTPPGAVPADYVFEPDYKLAPLSEIEAFTKANKHLPEVPSASEMTTEGVDLAKMNMVLLKKVEELTLHAIAQEKRLDQQQKLIEGLLSERPNR